jgi:hypothetical protein
MSRLRVSDQLVQALAGVFPNPLPEWPRLRKLGLIARLDYLESKAMLYAAAAEAAVLTVAHVDEREG